MKKVWIALVVMAIGCFSIYWWLEEQKSDLEQKLESSRDRQSKSRVTSRPISRRLDLEEVRTRALGSGDFFEKLAALENVDRDGLRDLVLEALPLKIENRYPRDEDLVLAKEAILLAAAKADSEWLFQELLRENEDSSDGLISQWTVTAWDYLFKDNPEKAISVYEELGGKRYELDGNRGPLNQLYQVVFAYLGKREPDRAVKHLFAMDVGVRNLPSPRLFDFQSIEEIEALQKAVSEIPTDRHYTREKFLGILMAESYRLGGQDDLRGFFKRQKEGDGWLELQQRAGLTAVFQSPQGAKDLLAVLEKEPEEVREGMMESLASRWTYIDRAGAETWVKTLPGGPERDGVVGYMLFCLMEVDEEPKRELVDLIEDAELREKWLKRGE